MRKREADYFRVRRPTLKHTAKIPDSRSRDQREYDLVIERVFERKHAVYRAPADDNAKDTYAARYFYENLYVRSELKSGWSGGATATPKDFIEDVILREGDIGRNRVSYLIGDVGVGKTVFANWLISTQLRKHVEEGKIWFLRMDLEDLKSGEPVSHRELIYHLIHYLCDEVVPHNQPVFSGFEKEIEKLKTTLSDAHEDHFNRMFLDRTKALCELANKIQKASSRRFVLILDNIDYICHIHDRGLYDDLQDTGEIPVLLKICESILQFNRKRELGHLGANVVIVTRPDSHDTMERAMVASYESPSATDGAVYWLKAAKLKDVVQNHCALLKEVTRDEPEGRRNRYLKIPKIIERDLETGSPMLVDHLLSITNLGLRQVMGFFAQYGWVSGGYDEGGPRLLGSYPIGLLTFMLNGKARFSEEDSRFPNVYLVNKRPSTVLEGDQPSGIIRGYWLKRLILELIANGNFNDVRDIVDLFHAEGKGYEQGSILVNLGSLTDSLTCNCVVAERRLHPNRSMQTLVIHSLGLNRRGKHCLEHIVDRFYYLQLIVEDPSLPIPSVLADEFDYELLDSRNVDYTYLVKEQSEYALKKVEMINRKAQQVLLFLDILESSLECERDAYQSVFDALEARYVEIPNVSRIKDRILEELRILNNSIGGRLDIDAARTLVSSKRDITLQHLKLAYAVQR